MKKILFLVCVLIVNCSNPSKKEGDSVLMELIDPAHSNVHFNNELFEDENLNIITFEYFYNGAGVAIGDLNNDGLQDIWFSGNMVDSKLYLNQGGLQFEDITTVAKVNTDGKWATGATMVDINSDGWLDLYVCMAGPYGPAQRKNLFFINQKDGTFVEQAEKLGLDDDGHTTQAAFFDFDRDGDLDVYLLTNITEEIGPNVIRPKKLDGESFNTDRLYRNDNGHFSNVSRAAGILKEGYGLGVSISDINQDGWPDIYVSNDYLSNDLLYLNNQDGTFTDRAADIFMHTSYSAMGNDVADFNNDTYPDIIAVDMLPPDNKRRKLMFSSINYNRYRSEILKGYYPQFMRNTLQLNNGIQAERKPVFSEIGNLAGVASTDWSWSALFADMDNDGLKDLLITNGYPRDITNMDFASYKANLLTKGQYNQTTKRVLIEEISTIEGAYLPNYIYQNTGDLRFNDQSANWGFTKPSYSTGAAFADLDNDGDLDYVVNNTFDKAFLYENKSSGNHYLRIKLKGTKDNPMGIGTKVYCYAGQNIQYQEFFLSRGFQSSVEPMIHFGLGSNNKVDSLRIIWPDQKQDLLKAIDTDQVIELDYNSAQSAKSFSPLSIPLFNEVTEQLNINYKHQESHYNDFRIQPLLPHKYSQEGPALANGDINGDGLEDFFVGGAFKQSGALFTQSKNGQFTAKALTDSIKYEEDTDALFFDADLDGDLDLYVVSGGSEFQEGSTYYQDRLYLNDGKGNFNLDRAALPEMYSSGSTVASADFDGDGDLDLFIGGRCSPNAYPLAGTSYLLQNNNGRFTDVTEQLAPKLKYIGMVTDACWVQLGAQSPDNLPSLVLCGEWMGIELFNNEKGRLSRASEAWQLEETVGWWNTVVAADLDQDGDTDLVAGNLGLNTPLKTSKSAPIELHLADYDNNGRLDPILTHYLQGQKVPLVFRDDLLSWILPLRKSFQDYTSYAEANWKTVYEIFKSPSTQVLRAHTFHTCWFENINGKMFQRHTLPIEAQFGPVNAIVVDDFNQDRKIDLLLAGNDFSTETHTGRYDASVGCLLLGNGDTTFNALSTGKSGIYIPGDTRSMVLLQGQPSKLIIGRNNEKLLTFQKK